MFSQASVILPQGGGHVVGEACVDGGHALVHGRGYVWQGACVVGGMHGRVCMVGGHAWQGACVA